MIDLLQEHSANFIGSFLSGLVALFIFYCGNRNNKFREKEKNLVELNRTLDYFVKLLDNELIPINKNIKNYKDFIFATQKSPTDEIYFYRTSSYNLERIKLIDGNKLLEAINLKEEVNGQELFYNLFQAIDYFRTESDLIHKLLYESLGKNEQIRIDIQNKFENFSNYCSDYILKNTNSKDAGILEIIQTISLVSIPYYKELRNSDNSNISLEYSCKNLLHPLREKLFSSNSMNNEGKYFFLSKINEILARKNTIKSNSLELCKVFQQNLEKLENMRDQVISNLEEIKKNRA